MRACFVIMAGLPGTGKSTLPRRLAAELRGVVLDKDLVRAALFAEPWIEYSREQDDFCVEVLLQAGGYLVAQAAPPTFLFVDGRTFALRYQRQRVAEHAASLQCRVKILHLVCDDEKARERLDGDHVAKNRDFELYMNMKAVFEPIDPPHLTLNTDDGLTDALIHRSIEYLKDS